LKLSQKGKRQASKSPARDPSKNKRQKRVGDASGGEAAPKAPSPPLRQTQRHGRNVILPSRYN
ncbi:hypothetical protein EK21DRAFT_83152, partial [Setomelanomma holmii]